MRSADLFFVRLVSPGQVRRVLLLGILTAGCLAVTGHLRLLHNTQAADGQQNLAQLSADIRLPVSGRGHPHLNLTDGRALLTDYRSGNAPTAPIAHNTAHPLTLASADFDEDGVPDLISGHADQDAGLLVFYRGNVDAVYPHTPAAATRRQENQFTDAPFLAPGVVWRVPGAADFLGAGDFNADGHNDIVTASRRRAELYLLPGDGQGGFGEAQTKTLPGVPTAFVTGETNRADGLQDIVAGVTGKDGPAVLVWEGPEGAWRWSPEVFQMSSRVNALAVGQFDQAGPRDVAVASGRELVFLYGRDRQLSLGPALQRQVAPARRSRRLFPQTINALAVGAYSNYQQDEIAALDNDGGLRVLARPTPGAALSAWRSTSPAGPRRPARARLITIRATSQPHDNLLLLDAANRALELLGPTPASVLLATTDTPVALLPLRLNPDAVSDWVLLTPESAAPVIVQTAPNATFTVTNTNASGLGSLCQAILNANDSPGLDLIVFNISAGPQTRTINLLETLIATEAVTVDGTTEPGYNGTPLVELRKDPASTAQGLRLEGGNSVVKGLAFSNFSVSGEVAEALTLAGSGHSFAESNLFGPRANEPNYLAIESAAPNNVIGGTAAPARNEILNSVRGVEVKLAGSGTKIQGNRIANNPNRVSRTSDNSLSGINMSEGGKVVNAPVLIGGTQPGARNIIQECLNRFVNGGGDVELEGIGIVVPPRRQGVLIQGNYIGTDETGQIAMGNGQGIISESEADPTIGGTTPAARNVISGNQQRGISTGGSLIQGNYIGLNANGTAALSNLQSGIHQSDSVVGSTIGGAVVGARNIISGNGTDLHSSERDGVRLVSGCVRPEDCVGTVTPSVVQGNFIGTDATGTARIPNAEYGLLLSVVSARPGFTPGPIIVGGPAEAQRNIISSSGLDGIRLGLNNSSVPLPGGTGITIENNYLGTDVNGAANLGNQRNGIFVDANCVHNAIRNNVIAFNGANGINIPNFLNPGFEIEMDANRIFANALLGIDLGPDGVTANDPGDSDAGANLLQNFPVLTGVAAPVAGSTAPQVTLTVNGTLNSNANNTYTVHWYFSNVATCANNQPGPPLVFGRIPSVTTDANGNAAFNFPLELPGGVTNGTVNTTATDPNGNTSEFSQCQAITAPAATNTFQFSAAAYDTNEGDGQATFIVTRVGNLSAAATIDYNTQDLSAEQRSDYAAASGTLSFAPNETSKTFAVLLTDDVYAETFEQFRVRLSNATSPGAGLGVRSQATVTITDNDPPTDNNRHFTARLAGAQVVPPFDNIPAGSGTGALTLNDAEIQATVNFSVNGLSSAQTAAHIHGPGLVGSSAPILFTVPNGVSNINVTPAQVNDLRAGRWYFDVHTANHNANGELRGQIMNGLPEDPSFFVRQQYADFLSREPDTGGVNYWTQELVRCAHNPASCPPGSNYVRRRWEVSNAFFFELEYQQTGAYVYRLYRAAYGNTQPFPNPGVADSTPILPAHVPSYASFTTDRARVVGGPQLAATQQALAASFAARPEFAARYPASLSTGAQFVDAVLATLQTDLSVNLSLQRAALLGQYDGAGGGNNGRGAVLFRLAQQGDAANPNPINNSMFIDAEYNRAFVITQYFGYLRRDGDLGGLNFWLGVVNQSPPRDVNRQLGMVCAFITSQEYQQRFGLVSPRGNSECP